MPGTARELGVRPFLLVLSSPSGAGKTTIARQLLSARSDLGYSISATTRVPRPGEQDGVDYYFLSNEEFQRRVGAGEFIEWASYGGHRYGTLRSQVERKLALGKHVVLDIEVIGARQVRQGFTNSVHVFILPPSAGTLTRRLAGRKTEDRAALLRRMEHAAQELGQVFEYEYVVVNDDLPRAIAEVTAIVDAETRRVTRCVGLAGLVETMRRDVAAERERIERGHLPVPD